MRAEIHWKKLFTSPGSPGVHFLLSAVALMLSMGFHYSVPDPAGNDMHAYLSFREIQTDANSKARVSVTGTGRTTGHIATLIVKNDGSDPILLVSGTFYIPSDGVYQSYIGRISKPVTVSSGSSETISVKGYCLQFRKPPVPSGVQLPAFDRWILIRDEHTADVLLNTYPGTSFSSIPGSESMILPDLILEPFEPAQTSTAAKKPMLPPHETLAFPDRNPGYRYTTRPPVEPFPTDYENSAVLTIPGTVAPLNGTIDQDMHPNYVAPILVKAVSLIIEAAIVVRNGGMYPTPFSPQPDRELHALIQQTIWIVTTALSGDVYDKDDFSEIVYAQHEENTVGEQAVSGENHDPEIQEGVDQFWIAFSAVGIEAKVISVSGLGIDYKTGPKE